MSHREGARIQGSGDAINAPDQWLELHPGRASVAESRDQSRHG
jgi:hypothetical protein